MGFAYFSFKMTAAASTSLPPRSSATCCFKGRFQFLSTDNTILKKDDGRFKDIIQKIYEAYVSTGIRIWLYVNDKRIPETIFGSRHLLRASSHRQYGGAGDQIIRRLCLGNKELRRRLQSDILAQGVGSLGMMTSERITPDGLTVESEAAHGTVTRHYANTKRVERRRRILSCRSSHGRRAALGKLGRERGDEGVYTWFGDGMRGGDWCGSGHDEGFGADDFLSMTRTQLLLCQLPLVARAL